jgi:hypothetical protein
MGAANKWSSVIDISTFTACQTCMEKTTSSGKNRRFNFIGRGFQCPNKDGILAFVRPWQVIREMATSHSSIYTESLKTANSSNLYVQ